MLYSKVDVQAFITEAWQRGWDMRRDAGES